MTTNTRAALDAVLAAIDNDTHEGRAVSLSDHAGLKSAIYAHVAANVAACNAGWQARDASNDEARVAAEVARALACAPDVEEAIGAYGLDSAYSDCYPSRDGTAKEDLRAAIAADKARAVEAGISSAFAKLLPGRPTPDEARRLVDAFASVVDRLAGFADDPPANRDHYNTQMDRLIADHKDARAALLRALGVEA